MKEIEEFLNIDPSTFVNDQQAQLWIKRGQAIVNLLQNDLKVSTQTQEIDYKWQGEFKDKISSIMLSNYIKNPVTLMNSVKDSCDQIENLFIEKPAANKLEDLF